MDVRSGQDKTDILERSGNLILDIGVLERSVSTEHPFDNLSCDWLIL